MRIDPMAKQVSQKRTVPKKTGIGMVLQHQEEATFQKILAFWINKIILERSTIHKIPRRHRNERPVLRKTWNREE